MPAPLDFEEAQEYMAWEPVFRGMRVYMQEMRKAERQERERVHVRWKRHWRTRLAGWLRTYASRLDLPEPPLELKKPK